MHPRTLLLSGLLGPVVLACSITGCSTPAVEELPVDLGAWRTEPITLPPDFAPTLPAGEELLIFAPGMFEEGAEDFWSYGFLIRFEETDLDLARMEELFELYYDGLIGTVGAERVSADPARVQMRRVRRGRYAATINTVDAFVTFEPLVLRLEIEVLDEDAASTLLRVTASPQPKGHGIWRALDIAVGSLEL